MIDKPTIARIMDSTKIEEVVSEFVTLKKRGINYIGLCPFHNDSHPSFSVSPTRGICHCFTCGKGGNAVNFLMELEQMSYPDALRWLAKKYNIEIQEREMTNEEKQRESERESMYIVNDWAAKYFQDILQNDVDGRAIGMQYFRSRGFRDDRMYYSYANKDFTELTTPQLLFDWGYATIDADINLLDDGLYHMLIKKEGGKPGIYTATSKYLTHGWGEPVEDDYVSFEGRKSCEGSSAFQLIGDKTWRVAYIQYSDNPKHYRICKADENLRNFHDTRSRFADFKKAVGDDLKGRAAGVQEEIDFALKRIRVTGTPAA